MAVSTQSQGIQTTVGGQVTNPQLPTATKVQVTPQQISANEVLGTGGLSTTTTPQLTPQTAQVAQQHVSTNPRFPPGYDASSVDFASRKWKYRNLNI